MCKLDMHDGCSAASGGDMPMLDYFLYRGCDPNVKTKLGRSSLSKACWNGMIDVVKKLADQPGIDLNCKDNSGRTALHNAVWGEYGGRLGFKTALNPKDSPECALVTLFLSCLIQFLLQKGADPNAQDNACNTPLNIASSTCAPDCIDILMEYGADLNIPSFKGAYPIHKAMYRGNYECLQKLLKYSNYCFLKCLDPDLRVRNNRNLTPLEMMFSFN